MHLLLSNWVVLIRCASTCFEPFAFESLNIPVGAEVDWNISLCACVHLTLCCIEVKFLCVKSCREVRLSSVGRSPAVPPPACDNPG